MSSPVISCRTIIFQLLLLCNKNDDKMQERTPTFEQNMNTDSDNNTWANGSKFQTFIWSILWTMCWCPAKQLKHVSQQSTIPVWCHQL